MKRLKDILDKYTDKQIMERFFKIYPDQQKSFDGYIKVLKDLRKLKPIKSNYILVPKKSDISALDTKDNIKYAIEFTRWEIWLGMPVKTTDSYLDAFCYSLWEMTFMGFSQQPIQRKINILNKTVERIKLDEQSTIRKKKSV
jgi:hypothetical protein